jgi:hypothetical protein
VPSAPLLLTARALKRLSCQITRTVPKCHLHYCDDGSEIKLPHKWEICSYCRGEGKSSAYLGAYTTEEWDQMDTDWQEDYIAGHFDRACEHCAGGKVQVPDWSRMTKPQRKQWNAQCRAEAECRAEERYERRMMGDWG